MTPFQKQQKARMERAIKKAECAAKYMDRVPAGAAAAEFSEGAAIRYIIEKYRELEHRIEELES